MLQPQQDAELPDRRIHTMVRTRREKPRYITEESDARNKGLAFQRVQRVRNDKVTRVAKYFRAKQPQVVHCRCKEHCYEKFDALKLRNLFNAFYESGKIADRRRFISLFVTTTQERGFSRYHYYLPAEAARENHVRDEKLSVCRAFFLGALDVTTFFVSYTLRHKKGFCSGFVTPDQRGKHNKSGLKEGQFEAVCRHINSIERLPAHYCRQHTKRQFIDSFNSLTTLHEMYKRQLLVERDDWIYEHPLGPGDEIPSQFLPVSYKTYWRIFKYSFKNISLKRPKVDKCRYCMRYEHLQKGGEATRRIDRLWANHVERKNAARAALKADKTAAEKNSEKLWCIQFDLERFAIVYFCLTDVLQQLDITGIWNRRAAIFLFVQNF